MHNYTLISSLPIKKPYILCTQLHLILVYNSTNFCYCNSMCIKEIWGYDVVSFELDIGLMVKKVKQRLGRWSPSCEVSYWRSLIPIIWPHVDIMIQSSHHNFFHLLVNDLKSWHNSYYSFECSRNLLQWTCSLVFLLWTHHMVFKWKVSWVGEGGNRP
jgi:hypothetical protein